jgi:hypothetical protein
MLTTLEAIIDKQGNVRLTEPIDLSAARRALVVVLDEPAPDILETACDILNDRALQIGNSDEQEQRPDRIHHHP